MDSLSSSTQTTFYPLSIEQKGGHHWLSVCRENDHVLVFDTFGRSLQQIEINYTEPHFKRYLIEAFPDCQISTNTQVLQDTSTAVCGRYAILVGRLFSPWQIYWKSTPMSQRDVFRQCAGKGSNDCGERCRKVNRSTSTRTAQTSQSSFPKKESQRKRNRPNLECWFSRHECFFEWQSRCQVPS